MQSLSLSTLNEKQREAASVIDGPCLLIAGAGTGKTKTLTHRIANLIDNGVLPESILAITFTNKAANEMKTRILAMLGDSVNKRHIEISTYHSFAVKVLRKFAPYMGMSSDFTIADKAKSTDIIDLVKESLGYNKRCKDLPTSSQLNSIFSVSRNKKESIQNIVCKQYPKFKNSIGLIEQLFGEYQTWKKEHDNIDYEDILEHFNYILQNNSKIRRYLSSKYKYIMVDEYQDSNSVQFDMLKNLCLLHQNIFVVGDDQQSIFLFRGAEFKNIINFPNEFKPCKTIVLTQNYRSTQSILDIANVTISNATEKYEKELVAVSEKGELPKVVHTQNNKEESEYVLEKIKQIHQSGVPLHEIAVLSRGSINSSYLELKLDQEKIPFRKFGGISFLEKAHIRDILSYLSILVNDMDEVAWFRILKLYKGIGNVNANRIKEKILAEQSYHALLSKDFSRKNYQGQLKLLHEIITTLSQMDLTAQIEYLIENHLKDIYENLYPDDFEDRIEECYQLLVLSKEYPSTRKFLDDITIEPPSKNKDVDETEFVTVSTIHSAKGLEFQVVFILDCVDMINFSYEGNQKTLEEVEEERRLFYVSVTRAKKDLYMMCPDMLYQYNSETYVEPSRFLEELSECQYEEVFYRY